MAKYLYNDLVKENGFLTDQGNKLINEKFLPIIQEFLTGMKTENEIQVFSGILANIIGKEAANQIQVINSINKVKNQIKEGTKYFIGKENTKETQEEIKKTIIDGGFLPDPFDSIWPVEIK